MHPTTAQAILKSVLLRYVALPSFVLADTDGTILATSDETKWSALNEILAGMDVLSDSKGGGGSHYEGFSSPAAAASKSRRSSARSRRSSLTMRCTI